MPIRPIVQYGADVLGRRAEAVTAFDAELRALIADMIQTMYAAPGVGLAAPQIGLSLRLAVIDTSVGERAEDLLVLVNPEIVATEGEQEGEEGCLSLKDVAENLRRPAVVEVRAQDAEGRSFTRRGEGLLARAFQHEVDHLDGKLFVERLAPLQRTLVLRRVAKRRRAGGG